MTKQGKVGGKWLQLALLDFVDIDNDADSGAIGVCVISSIFVMITSPPVSNPYPRSLYHSILSSGDQGCSAWCWSLHPRVQSYAP